MLSVDSKEAILVPTEMLHKEERPTLTFPRPQPARFPHEKSSVGGPVEPKQATGYLTWKDLAGTAAAALVLLAYVANVQGWWYLGSNRWAAVTMVVVGAIGCQVGARLVGEEPTSLPIVLLGMLGVAALTLAILAIVTAQWALLALAILVLALWAGSTLRHAVSPPPRFVPR
jgi:hypothetical protein